MCKSGTGTYKCLPQSQPTSDPGGVALTAPWCTPSPVGRDAPDRRDAPTRVSAYTQPLHSRAPRTLTPAAAAAAAAVPPRRCPPLAPPRAFPHDSPMPQSSLRVLPIGGFPEYGKLVLEQRQQNVDARHTCPTAEMLMEGRPIGRFKGAVGARPGFAHELGNVSPAQDLLEHRV